MRKPSSAIFFAYFVNYTLLFLEYVEVLEVEVPFVALAEGGLEALFEDALFLEMDVAIAVAGSAADGAGVGVLRRRIEEDVVEDLACGLGCDLCLAGDDLETVLEIREGIGVHKTLIEPTCYYTTLK